MARSKAKKSSQVSDEAFVDRLVDHFVAEFKSKHDGMDLTTDARSVRRLRICCTRAYDSLMSTELHCTEFAVQIDSLFDEIDFYTSITRARLEELCADLFARRSKGGGGLKASEEGAEPGAGLGGGEEPKGWQGRGLPDAMLESINPLACALRAGLDDRVREIIMFVQCPCANCAIDDDGNTVLHYAVRGASTRVCCQSTVHSLLPMCVVTLRSTHFFPFLVACAQHSVVCTLVCA
jgi:hypothetical protein